MGISLSKAKDLGQVSLFGADDAPDRTDKLPDIPELEKNEKLNLEKELLGFYLTEHPHAEKIKEANEMISHRISELYSDNVTNQIVTVCGIVEQVRAVVTKNGNLPMCFAKITDQVKSVEVVVFPKTYALAPTIWQQDKLVLVKGKVESRSTADSEEDFADSNQELTIIADAAAEFVGAQTVLPASPNSANRYRPNGDSTPPPAQNISTVTIEVPSGTSQTKLIELNSLLQSYRGNRKAELVFLNGSSAKTIPLPFGLRWTSELQDKIRTLF